MTSSPPAGNASVTFPNRGDATVKRERARKMERAEERGAREGDEKRDS